MDEKINYKNIGLKSGIEIHQQLDTEKLFCRCPSLLRKDSPQYKVTRKLHAVPGESGEIDIAAKHEVTRDREFIYEGYDTNCLVELDEEPPHQINQQALEIAIQISLLLHCKILPVSQIMRKTVINGSNTSGFQRTVLIAREGYVETDYGKVRIDGVNLEEDAARETGKQQGKIIFRLDRLGIPLVEIGTAPDIKNPKQAKQAALKIGEILRACKVKRGIGTIRQDVNMSIKNGQRIEIKGVQEPKLISKTIKTEIKRQKELVKNNKSKPEVRKANPNGSTTFLRPLPGSARMYPETDLPLLVISKQMIDKAKKTLPKLRTEIKQELKITGLNEEMIKILLNENKLEEFKNLVKIYNKPNFIVKTLILWPNEIASHNNISNIEEKIPIDAIEHIIQALAQKKINEQNVKNILKDIAKGKTLKKAMEIEKTDKSEIEEEIINLIKQKPSLSIGAYMGLLMKKYKGKISGKELSELLKKHLKK